MSRRRKIKTKWVLVFWTESEEISVIKFSDICQAVKPSLIKRNWVGDLPWIEDDITVLYEVKILKVSNNKKYLDSIVVDANGKIKKKLYLPPIYTALKLLKFKKRRMKKAKANSKNKFDQTTLKMFNIDDITDSDDDSDLDNHQLINNVNPKVMEPVLPSTSKSNNGKQMTACDNCNRCVCRDWNNLLSSEITAFMTIFAESFMNKKDLKTAMLHQSETMVELCPNTEIFISKCDLNMALSKAKNRPKVLIIQILTSLFTIQDIIRCGSALNFNKTYGFKIQKAVKYFVERTTGLALADGVFNEVLKKFIQHQKKLKKKENNIQTDQSIKLNTNILDVNNKRKTTNTDIDCDINKEDNFRAENTSDNLINNMTPSKTNKVEKKIKISNRSKIKSSLKRSRDISDEMEKNIMDKLTEDSDISTDVPPSKKLEKANSEAELKLTNEDYSFNTPCSPSQHQLPKINPPIQTHFQQNFSAQSGWGYPNEYYNNYQNYNQNLNANNDANSYSNFNNWLPHTPSYSYDHLNNNNQYTPNFGGSNSLTNESNMPSLHSL